MDLLIGLVAFLYCLNEARIQAEKIREIRESEESEWEGKMDTFL